MRKSVPGVEIVRGDGAKRCKQKKRTVRGLGRGERDEGKPVVPFFKEELVQVHQNIPD